ncbi:hypothetical protein [Ochrobactrum sp. Q0168]|uniref:hypothetical protein n=1 Tax=Ochrobactrum sp. Q0168 TaxID=2793241 RepID=UPI001AEEA321
MHITYHLPGRARPVHPVNEIRLPVGERGEFQLASTDVVHSFWTPSLDGKIDIILGHENHSLVEYHSGTYPLE